MQTEERNAREDLAEYVDPNTGYVIKTPRSDTRRFFQTGIEQSMLKDVFGGSAEFESLNLVRVAFVLKRAVTSNRCCEGTTIVSGASGISLEIAEAFAEAGANVAIWYPSNKHEESATTITEEASSPTSPQHKEEYCNKRDHRKEEEKSALAKRKRIIANETTSMK
ncbi:hypothetical protein TRIATDRAFT_310247 [Trichoderma atroviride IMI 206040]|uniref:Uncharacterized protein n=1 Tax=Hypocrea atroviridis (strain ATCC 20476 / IMI 206040) TaxID=452589 RepID=G9P2C1_HYPAI|nr:uncharacterized protein TRIATDRAFT_310247 [Trichoderma atroviride IMI 206040]EHK42660.1 hypothetical protein TRIATDRAFT_310247 [Trichoderma atroviride IMI 206040]